MNAESLLSTIEPKSDQLNADDLISGPITVTVSDVIAGVTPEQPVQLLIEGRRPYRPCKSMRRVLIAAWGDQGKDWVGRSMTLFCDPSVKFGGVAVGGIRISHLSDIDNGLTLMLTTTRSKRAKYTVKRLASTPLQSVMESINAAESMEALAAAGKDAAKLATDGDKAAARAAWKARKQRLEAPAATVAVSSTASADDLADRTAAAQNGETLDEIEGLANALPAAECKAVQVGISLRRRALQVEK